MGATTGFAIRASKNGAVSSIKTEALSSSARAVRRRRIDRQSGHALEVLGHAIEYLADEYVHTGRVPDSEDPSLKAIQILMAANRDVYHACPVVPTLEERWHALWHR